MADDESVGRLVPVKLKQPANWTAIAKYLDTCDLENSEALFVALALVEAAMSTIQDAVVRDTVLTGLSEYCLSKRSS